MRLPLELRDELDRKIAARQLTNAQLLSFVRSKKPDADISRSGLARYAQRHRAQLEEEREQRLMGSALAETLGQAANGEHGRLLSEMLRLIVFQSLRPAFEGGASPRTEELLKFATAVQRMAAADKLDAESAIKRQEESALKHQEEARQAKRAKQAGLSDQEKIRRALFADDDQDQDQ
ncbi:MAG: phage protein Gp27 family protein [Candidatus Binataceae bacterium]